MKTTILTQKTYVFDEIGGTLALGGFTYTVDRAEIAFSESGRVIFVKLFGWKLNQDCSRNKTLSFHQINAPFIDTCKYAASFFPEGSDERREVEEFGQ